MYIGQGDLFKAVYRTYGTALKITFRPDFTSKLVHGLAFGTPKFYTAPYDKINH